MRKEEKKRKRPYEYDAMVVVTDEWHARSVKRREKREKKRKDNAHYTYSCIRMNMRRNMCILESSRVE